MDELMVVDTVEKIPDTIKEEFDGGGKGEDDGE